MCRRRTPGPTFAEIVSATGGYTATGTIRGQWMPSIVTLKPS
jgi:hypothetical protein